MSSLPNLLTQYQPGFGLPREFYQSKEVYQAEIERIWRRGWLFVGHACQLPKPGDYFVFEMDTDAIIIARAETDAIVAFHNVCRHRGSLVVTTPTGHARRLVCPYHQWMYALDGSLQTCRGMPETLDKELYGLLPVQVREVAGLIFISLAASPPDFEPAQKILASLAQPQGFERARVAHSVDYTIRANWKLIWENNRECYHCDACHPQYIQANFDRYDAENLSEAIARQIALATERSRARWEAQGLEAPPVHAGLFHFPDAANNIWYSANRTALAEGYVTESLNGQRVAPLMGAYTDEEVGTLRLRTLPNFWNHSSCDHAVSTWFAPAGPGLTRLRVMWLVAETAQVERDYVLENLLPFWQLTSEQDWEICERVQRGVNSSAYQPGPLSPSKEYNVDDFLRWYIRQLSQ